MPTHTSFRRRLLTTTGPAIVGSLGVLCLLVWLATYSSLNHSALDRVEQEANAVRTDILMPQGTLLPEQYSWYEPHHRFTEHRIDPHFVQVFDQDGGLLRASDNIALLSPSYPDTLLTRTLHLRGWIPQLHTFTVQGEIYYAITLPLVHHGDAPVGYIQVSRYAPDDRQQLRNLGLFLTAIFLAFSVILLGLVSWSATRVLGPLQAITRFASNLSSHQLDARVILPPHADQETALLAHRLNDLLHRLEQSFEEVRQFTANAAHELQTPITILKGHVEVSLRRPRDTTSYQQTLQVLDTTLAQLTRTVRALLMLSRMDREAQVAHTPLNASLLLHQTCDHVEALYPESPVQIVLDITPDVWLTGQAELLRELVINLLDNAFKYTRTGHITVQLTQADDQIVLTIHDTGTGIPPDVLPHIWDRFYRGPAMDTAGLPGSGLGLSLVQQIVHLHGGTITVSSVVDEGTRFTVTLPKGPSHL